MNAEKGASEEKGQHAERPSQIPKRGWKEIGSRVMRELTEDNISIVSAGVAYYFFLALFPALIAAISLYGLVMDPADAEQQIGQIAQVLPEQATEIVSRFLQDVAGSEGQTLGWGLILSLLFSFWTAHNGTGAVFEGVNIAYNERDERGFFKYHGITLLFTLGGIAAGIICTALVVVFPVMVESLNMPSMVETLIQWLRWLLLALIIIGGLGLTYKVGPDRRNPEVRWVTHGSVIATVLWLLGSILFSLYMDNFGDYDEMYGSFAAVIILMVWFFITAYAILLGAEINSEMEHQTRTDSTIGEDKPMGEREAYHADHMPEGDEGKDPDADGAKDTASA
ncbi:MAG: YihY/virulence factor BrkB family protein [Balneolaceae bacterium]